MKMKMKMYVVGLVLIIGILLISGCSNTTQTQNVKEECNEPSNYEVLTLGCDSLKKGYECCYSDIVTQNQGVYGSIKCNTKYIPLIAERCEVKPVEETIFLWTYDSRNIDGNDIYLGGVLEDKVGLHVNGKKYIFNYEETKKIDNLELTVEETFMSEDPKERGIYLHVKEVGD